MNNDAVLHTKQEKFSFSSFVCNIFLLLSSIILFTLPQPNLFVHTGLPFFAFFQLIPLFILVQRISWKFFWLWGFAYGFGCYAFYAYWLGAFHPLGIAVIASLYGIYLLLAFPFLKAAPLFFKKNGWLVQWVIWCAYEYVKTCGFSGFDYGVSGYAMWQSPVFLQSASIAGVWGVSALITFPSAWLSGIICKYCQTKKENNGEKTSAIIAKSIFTQKISALVWIVFLCAAIVYGIKSPVDYSGDKTVKIALIQPNNDPWRGGFEAYSQNLDSLIKLSDEALASDSEIGLVVWPETAFVPRIEWHYKYRQERNKFLLVERLLTYLDNAPVPFLLGNDHAVLDYSRSGKYEAVDYNSALLFRPGENCLPPAAEIYSKMHLVPFTEYFPYEKIFPRLYQGLLNGDTHLWEPGNTPVVFDAAGFKFGVPICFEDTFGEDCRRFVNNGAQAFVNISNDAWSHSMACQYQHLSMAVFRCVENRVPAVRATASGQTCMVDPNGKVLEMAEPFKETWLVTEIPVSENSHKTIYTRYGDFVGKFFAIMAFMLFVFGIAKTVLSKKSKEK